MTRVIRRIAWLTALSGMSCATMARGADDATTPVSITLHPAAAPRPALKYQLLPPFMVRTPGNAAVYYGKVKSEQNAFFGSREWQEKIYHWEDAPLQELRSESARVPLGRDFLTAAARCESCDWQLPVRTVPYASIPLPEAQETRYFARVLKVHARIALAHGDFGQAIETLQDNFALGRHVAAGQTLVNGLIGTAIVGFALKDVQELIQQPGAPNLYWALTALPNPPVDFRSGLDAESEMLPLTIVELQSLHDAQLTGDQWRTRLLKVMQEVHQLQDQPDWEPSEKYLDEALSRLAPQARQSLLARRTDAETVEAMADAQAVLIDWMDRYRNHVDELVASWNLSYPDSQRRFDAIVDSGEQDWKSNHDIMHVVKLTSGLRACRRAQVRTQRQVAVLRVLEALRMHAVAHDGQLPTRLSEVTEAPIPLDPVTDLPFEFQLDGGVGRLSGPSLPDAPLNYEITMAVD